MEELSSQISQLLDQHLKSHDERTEKRIVILLEKLQPLNKEEYTSLKQRYHQQVLSYANDTSFLRKRNTANDSKVKTSDDIIKTLRNAVEMADREVGRTMDLHINLKESTKMAQKTAQEYRTMSSQLEKSSKTLKSISNKDGKDRWILAAAFGILLLTCLYLFYKRFWIPFL